MTQFDKLERALRELVTDAVARLPDGPEIALSYDRWRRDTDGVFRRRERPARIWHPDQVEALRQLPSWRAVEQALQEDDRLRVQLGQMVGTAQSRGQLSGELVGQHVLLLPDEVGELEN